MDDAAPEVAMAEDWAPYVVKADHTGYTGEMMSLAAVTIHDGYDCVSHPQRGFFQTWE